MSAPRSHAFSFADDLVLLAESEGDMQHLLDICAQVAHRDGFKFNMSETQWMTFNTAQNTSFHIGEQILEETTECTYLGTKIQSTHDYLDKHKAASVAKFNKLKENVLHLAKHSYNKYAVGIKNHMKTHGSSSRHICK